MLAIDVRLRFGTYDAGASGDPRRAEWPPEPSRVFCALVAGDPTDEEWAALEWLEQQGDPLVYSAPPRQHPRAAQFVITNESKAGSPLRPGRTAKERVKTSTVSDSQRFAVVWPEAAASRSTLVALRSLARRVPYVGRSSSQAVVDIDERLDLDERWLAHEPSTIAESTVDLGTPYPGYCAALRTLHLSGQRAWQARRCAPYRLARDLEEGESEAAAFGPLWRLLVLRADLRNTDISRAGVMGESLRRALLARIGDPPPAALHGHDSGIRHVGCLSLGNVGTPDSLPELGRSLQPSNEHADGSVLALALAMPVEMDDADVAKIVAACQGSWSLNIAGERQRHPQRATVERSVSWAPPYGATPGRWVGPSRLWVTATPVVFDGFGGARRDDSTMVGDAVERAGFPRPSTVWAQRAPMLPGAATCSMSSVLRRAGAVARPFSHAWIEFTEPVVGPVLAGSMRYRGLGLFAPIPET